MFFSSDILKWWRRWHHVVQHCHSVLQISAINIMSSPCIGGWWGWVDTQSFFQNPKYIGAGEKYLFVFVFMKNNVFSKLLMWLYLLNSFLNSSRSILPSPSVSRLCSSFSRFLEGMLLAKFRNSSLSRYPLLSVSRACQENSGFN